MFLSFEHIDQTLNSLFDKFGESMSPDDWSNLQEKTIRAMGSTPEEYDRWLMQLISDEELLQISQLLNNGKAPTNG
jgi:hypothetical protein